MKSICDWLPGYPGFIAAITGLILGMFLLWTWQQEREAVRQINQSNVDSTGEFVSDMFRAVLDDHVQSLQNLKKRIEYSGGEYFDNWTFDAGLIRDQRPSTRMIQWIDSTGTISRNVPHSENLAALGMNILELDYRRNDWLEMKESGDTNITPWLELVQGNHAFIVDVPIYFDGGFQGSISSGLDFTNRFEQMLIGREQFSVKIYDDEGTLFFQSGIAIDETSEVYRFDDELSLPSDLNRFWVLEVSSNQPFFESDISPGSVGELLLKLSLALLISMLFWIILVAYRTSCQKQTALDENRILISEIHHRVKNNLAIISGLLQIQGLETESEELKKVLQNTQDRIHSIAGVHELLYNTDQFHDIPFSIYLDRLSDQLLGVYSTRERGIDFCPECSDLLLNINQAIPLGMLISELITNSFKHAFEGDSRGTIELSLKAENGIVRVVYRDNGIGFDPDIFKKSSGIGFTIIRTLLDQLEATYTMDSENGFYLSFRFYQD
ncbi:MAG: ATP-binding protein [Balneolaceae bacterium]|nr:ATP-binding protein [Balneolaceae bacterium]